MPGGQNTCLYLQRLSVCVARWVRSADGIAVVYTDKRACSRYPCRPSDPSKLWLLEACMCHMITTICTKCNSSLLSLMTVVLVRAYKYGFCCVIPTPLRLPQWCILAHSMLTLAAAHECSCAKMHTWNQHSRLQRHVNCSKPVVAVACKLTRAAKLAHHVRML